MKVVLIGFMGSGKSRIGRLLAKKLGWTHVDTDESIAKEVGASPGDIIRKKGEPTFRALEKKVIAALQGQQLVVSTGGGAPLDPDNWRELSKDSAIVWLRVSPENVLKRIGSVASRPLIDPKDPLSSVKLLLEAREPAYSKARFTIDTDSLAPDEIVEKITTMINLPAR